MLGYEGQAAAAGGEAPSAAKAGRTCTSPEPVCKHREKCQQLQAV